MRGKEAASARAPALKKRIQSYISRLLLTRYKIKGKEEGKMMRYRVLGNTIKGGEIWEGKIWRRRKRCYITRTNLLIGRQGTGRSMDRQSKRGVTDKIRRGVTDVRRWEKNK